MIEIHDFYDQSEKTVDPNNPEQMNNLDTSERSLVEMVLLLNDVVTTGSMIAYFIKEDAQRHPFTATTNSNPQPPGGRRYWTIKE